ncbi:MAG: type II toxin-antitoxin system VapC family toxin [Thermoanaerobaculia bacterium]
MRIVLDANLLVSLAVPMDYSERAATEMSRWLERGVDLFAPVLWSYEAVSSLRKFVAAGQLRRDEADAALDRLLAFEVQDVAPSVELHSKALTWAERLQDFVAYDSAYLALAEQLDAPFWTADRKLAKKVRSLGFNRVHDVIGPL